MKHRPISSNLFQKHFVNRKNDINIFKVKLIGVLINIFKVKSIGDLLVIFFGPGQ